MRKMQDIQPRVKALQERYSHLKATDPGRQKMNQELMELYKMLPYVITILAVAGFVGRVRPPAANGTPYTKS